METSLPITALGTANERLFIGMGNQLLEKDLNLQPISNHSNHSKFPIVGIHVTSSKIIFWSKNEIFVFTSGVITSVKRISNYSVLFTDGSLVLLRQNAILNIDDIKSKILFCESNKLLYSGIIINSSKNHPESLICAGTIQNEIEIWNTKNGKIIGRGKGHGGSIFCLKFNDERNELYSGSDDRSVRIWSFEKLLQSDDSDDFEPITLWGHQGRVWSVLYVVDQLVSGGEDGVRIWSIINQSSLKFIPTRSSVWNLTTGTFSASSLVFAGMENGEILKLDISAEVIPNKTVIFPEIQPDNGTCFHLSFMVFRNHFQ